MIISTTGTSIQSYLDWIRKEIEKKSFGEVTIRFIVRDKRVVDVRRESVDNDHFAVKNDI